MKSETTRPTSEAPVSAQSSLLYHPFRCEGGRQPATLISLSTTRTHRSWQRDGHSPRIQSSEFDNAGPGRHGKRAAEPARMTWQGAPGVILQGQAREHQQCHEAASRPSRDLRHTQQATSYLNNANGMVTSPRRLAFLTTMAARLGEAQDTPGVAGTQPKRPQLGMKRLVLGAPGQCLLAGLARHRTWIERYRHHVMLLLCCSAAHSHCARTDRLWRGAWEQARRWVDVWNSIG